MQLCLNCSASYVLSLPYAFEGDRLLGGGDRNLKRLNKLHV